MLADISCAVADGARAIGDFRVLADQEEAFGQVASVPTAYRTLEEITRGGIRTEKKLTAAVSAARRHAWWSAPEKHRQSQYRRAEAPLPVAPLPP